jgi:hypothetical protein
MMETLRDRPVFICGHPKSGTSLLRSLLDRHPQLITYPEESVFFRRYLPRARGKSPEEQLLLSDRYLTHMFDWNRAHPTETQQGYTHSDYSHISAGELRAALRRFAANLYRHEGDILSAAMLAYGEATGQLSERSLHWVEKTPYNERYAEQIFAWWPEARCIHMLRDARDNYASYRRKHPEWTPITFATSWRHSTRLGQANEQKFGRERYRLIRFEDFTRNPEAMISDLCQFLGIEDNPSLRAPTREGRSWSGNSMFAEQHKGISTAPVGRGAAALKPAETYVIEKLCASPMQALNYPLSERTAAGVPLWLRLRTQLDLLIITLKEKKQCYKTQN